MSRQIRFVLRCLSLAAFAIGLLFLISGTSRAQSQPGSTAPSSRTVPPSLQKLYERRKTDMLAMDLNGDGVLSPEELAAATQSKFDAADIDKDGIISAQERAASIGAFKQEGQKTYGNQVDNKAKQLENRYDAADANEDGQVSKQEYETYYGTRYQKFDKNGDGKLDLKEYQTDVENRRRRRRDNAR